MYQSSPGCQSSCSSEPSPLGSATNNDSGVDTSSVGDLSTLDHLPFVESLGFEELTGSVAAVGLHTRKQFGMNQYLEHLKKEKLKTVKDSCWWASKQTPPCLGSEFPPIPATGKDEEKQISDQYLNETALIWAQKAKIWYKDACR